MKILTAPQIKEADAFTIENEPILSIDLMERASMAFADKVMEHWNNNTPIKVFAGPGNNGGDALAVARLLYKKGYKVTVYIFNINDALSEDCKINLKRLQDCKEVELVEVTTAFTPPQLTREDLIIDGLFGTGLSRPLMGGFASVVKYINASPSTVVSIDVPSGLMCEDNSYNVMSHIVRANYTFTFQFPKLAFFFADMETYVGKWEVLDIGIKIPDTEQFDTNYLLTEETTIASMIRGRSRFAHKGSMGHATLIAGKRHMAGAAILASKAYMRTGAGKLTLRTQEANVAIMQTAVPEVVLDVEPKSHFFCQTFDAMAFDAMGIGPGIGTEAATAQAFIEQLRLTRAYTVIDADAINILGSHRGWIQQLPRNCILTPHKKELFGLISTTRNCYEELERTRELAIKQHLYIIIKGANSIIVTPEGKCHFNPTGNPGMATAGSGDVLTGIILSLLAQDYSPSSACQLGVYLHGLAGDIAKETYEEEGLMASDIIEALPKAFRKLKQINQIKT